MARLRYNFQSGTCGALTNVGTTITFAVAPAFATIVAPDFIPITLEPDTAGVQEIVYLTAYTAAATTGTILRGQEGTAGIAHSSGTTPWKHAATIADFDSDASVVFARYLFR